LPLVPFPHWTSFSVLAIEPINLLYYLAILAMVFKIGERAFDYRSGLMAATVVALWPSLLLHTTQLLRDPLLIVAVLFLVWSVVESLTRQLSLRRGLLLGIGSIAAVITIRIVRQPLWYLVVAAVGTAIVLLTVRAWREKQLSRGAIGFAVLLIGVVVITPRLQPYFTNQQESKIERNIVHNEVQKLPLATQISASRNGFNTYFDDDARQAPALDGSLIDNGIEIRNLGDIIRFIPRALEVGFFAPFPNMWFGAGRQVGSGGRWLAGIETLLTYVFECLALFGLWRARRELSAWFLVVFIGTGILALGLAVNNVGALYRFRYPFWILRVILGAGGVELLGKILLRKRPAVI
jgi:4-amino-4-deoxy-L-arabinose transferase-like glycosyltransferase